MVQSAHAALNSWEGEKDTIKNVVNEPQHSLKHYYHATRQLQISWKKKRENEGEKLENFQQIFLFVRKIGEITIGILKRPPSVICSNNSKCLATFISLSATQKDSCQKQTDEKFRVLQQRFPDDTSSWRIAWQVSKVQASKLSNKLFGAVSHLKNSYVNSLQTAIIGVQTLQGTAHSCALINRAQYCLHLPKRTSFESRRTICAYFNFGLKNSSFRLPYQRPSSSADCARELFKGSNGSASLVDCIRKKIFWLRGADVLWVTS